MAKPVAGEQYESITGQLFELGRQLRQPAGYPFDADHLKARLQDLIEGKFGEQAFEAPLLPKKKKGVLEAREDLSVGPLAKRFVPGEFFVTRPGLYLYNDMQRVLKGAPAVEPREATKLHSSDLKKNAYDREIKAELPENHKVELWEIAELIEAQKNGEDGPLLTNGFYNIFYVRGFAVSVRWYHGNRQWIVRDCGLDDARWRVDDRVFSRK